MHHKNLLLAFALFEIISTTSLAKTVITKQIPFVGCNSDGQIGPETPPDNIGQAPSVPVAVAPYLAYYVASNVDGVVAPRGWFCFGYYGSNGDFMLLSPDPAVQRDGLTLPNSKVVSTAGPGIQFTFSDIETSGRFEVAQIAARLFPSHRDFIQSVIAEKLRPASDFPFGPYPNDILTHKSADDVLFVTPAHETGMGTNSYLQKNDEPIIGEVIYGPGGVVELVQRLPRKLRFLAPSIFDLNMYSPPRE